MFTVDMKLESVEVQDYIPWTSKMGFHCWKMLEVCAAAFSFDIHSSAFHKRRWTACLSVTPVITLAMRSIKHSRVHIALLTYLLHGAEAFLKS